MNKPIETIRTTHGIGVGDFIVAVWQARRKQFALPLATAEKPIVHPEVNHGRWVVNCPTAGCGGAELADPDDPRFFCLSCYNAEYGGKFLPVQWPQRRKDIEEALIERRHDANRNWLPHESVIDLLAQTLEREHD